MIAICAVAGTWAWRGGWWTPGSAFWQFMASQDIAPLRINGEVFEWGTDLGDSLKFWRSDEIRLASWRYGGKHLRSFLDGVPYDQRIVLAHSHAGQAAVFAAAETGFPIARLLTVGTPNRADMQPLYAKAAQAIGRWHHVCSQEFDAFGFFGMLGDRHLGGKRTIAAAHQNIIIPGIGHSRLVNDPRRWPQWYSEGLVDFLKGL